MSVELRFCRDTETEKKRQRERERETEGEGEKHSDPKKKPSRRIPVVY